jgi:hydroxypyruvate reductase
MRRTSEQLREDALAIWQAGVDAVNSTCLITDHVRVVDDQLRIGDESFDLGSAGRLIVVGAGKAGAGMAAGLEQALGPTLLQHKDLTGWINVPDDCVRPLQRIHLHGARPAGVNEPREAGVEGAAKILELVRHAASNDLVLCLLSGGGSALLPAPIEGISLEDKQQVTRQLSASGANIEQLNTVRKQLSRIKGGGLAQACRANKLITLVISDVIGDPLSIIASGPTVPDTSTPNDALNVLRELGCDATAPQPVRRRLEQLATQQPATTIDPTTQVTNLVVGNNAVAVDASGIEAERRGYSHAMNASQQLEGAADVVGCHLADMASRMRHEAGPDCLITGGEPTVELVSAEQRGLGGRNQQLVLSAWNHIQQHSATGDDHLLDGIMMLSGGTDGEDGPTDAAGAFIDATIAQAAKDRSLVASEFLARNDAYHFFEPLGGLIKTGPTHTNVCDLRVVTVSQPEPGLS